jgi:hypothetical protein
VPRQAPTVRRILEFQATAGNRAVAAVLARMRASTVSDVPKAKMVTMYANDTYGEIPVGTQLEVTEPLTWSGEHVHTRAGEAQYWIHISDLKPSQPSGELAEAVQSFLAEKLVAEAGGTLEELTGAAAALAEGNLNAASASALLAKAAKAIDGFISSAVMPSAAPSGAGCPLWSLSG